ncbi:MAG: hypothetical protein AAF675_12090 [Pseudomonadota bacterium]
MVMSSEPKLPRETVAELKEAGIRRGPLLVVDCDEVIVEFAGHLARWLPDVGYEMRLKKYELEGAIFPHGDPTPVSFDAAINLINAFFEEQTAYQTPLVGAVEALSRLRREVQTVVLTNIPRPGKRDRLANLASLGLDLPVIVNSGGKGRALAWLAKAAGAEAGRERMVFVDDSPQQIASAARRAPHVGRIHFRGAEAIRHVLGHAEHADVAVEDWAACEAEIRGYLRL